MATRLESKFAVFSEIHHLERSSSKAGGCRWLEELFSGRAAPGDPGRGGQWDKSWWVGRDGTHKAAAVIKHYWGSEVLEGQINKAAQSSLRKKIHRNALTEHDCIAKEISEVTDQVQELHGSGQEFDDVDWIWAKSEEAFGLIVQYLGKLEWEEF